MFKILDNIRNQYSSITTYIGGILLNTNSDPITLNIIQNYVNLTLFEPSRIKAGNPGYVFHPLQSPFSSACIITNRE